MLTRSMLALLIAATLGGIAQAQDSSKDYPNKPIRIIVGFAAGGIADLGARLLGDHITRETGQPVVVENRTAAAGTVAALAVAKAPPDGTTLGLVLSGQLVINPFVQKQMPFDVLKELLPVAAVGEAPQMIAINAELPAKTLKEFVAIAKAKPGSLSYGSTGSGSSNHLSMELFRTMTGVELVHVPYKGSAPMVTDLLGGHVQVAFDNTPNVLPQVKAGKLRALAITGAMRSEMVPDVPTVSEAGVPGYEVGVWFGIVAPAGTPPAVLAKLNGELNRILAMPDVKQKFADQGVEPVGGPPERFAEHLKVQIEKWTKVVKESGAKVE